MNNKRKENSGDNVSSQTQLSLFIIIDPLSIFTKWDKQNTILFSSTKDVRFGIQIGSDWPQTGQILDFLRSDLFKTDVKKVPD